MTCHISENLILCDGRGNTFVGYMHCPFCCLPGDEPVRVLATAIFGGYCGEDVLCGRCGEEFSTDEYYPRNLSIEDRDENIARVASVADPKCSACHDTGNRSYRFSSMGDPEPCDCAASHPEPDTTRGESE